MFHSQYTFKPVEYRPLSFLKVYFSTRYRKIHSPYCFTNSQSKRNGIGKSSNDFGIKKTEYKYLWDC